MESLSPSAQHLASACGASQGLALEQSLKQHAVRLAQFGVCLRQQFAEQILRPQVQDLRRMRRIVGVSESSGSEVQFVAATLGP
jgi:hypothetical protein